MKNHTEDSQPPVQTRLEQSVRGLLGARLLILAMLILGVWSILSVKHGPIPVPKEESAAVLLPTPSHAEIPAVSMEQLPSDARKLVGKWQLKESIQREIDIRPDGTATMNVTLDYLTALIYGRHLTLQLNWHLKDDLLTQTVTGGTPPENVEKITKAFGSSLSYQVVKLNADEMVLKGPSGAKTFENWEALKPSAE